MTPELPRVTAVLLRWLLHPAERGEVLSELEGEFADRCARVGRMRARWWLWRQVLGSVRPMLGRSWFRGTTGFESEADRMRGQELRLESWIMDARFALRGLRLRPQYVLLTVL